MIELEVSKVKHESAVLCMVVLTFAASIPDTGQCGYRMTSSWHSDSRRIWYQVEVETGSPA